VKEVKPLSSSSSSSNSAATTTDTPRVAKKQKGKLLFKLNSPSIDNDSSKNIESDLIPRFFSPVSQQFQLERQNRVFDPSTVILLLHVS
jgi:hypothetical protein